MNTRDSLTRSDVGVRELRHIRLRLRDDIEFRYSEDGDQPVYIIEDRLRSRFYRIGVPERRMIALFDGNSTIEQALAMDASSGEPDVLDEEQAVIVVNWLIDNELVVPESGHDGGRLQDRARRDRRAGWLGKINLLYVRIPLFNPDRMLDRLLPWCRWMLGWGFFTVWLVAIISGLYFVAAHWHRFVADAAGFFALNNWLWLLVAWVLLKMVHELFHGLVCKKYGGDVYEAGVILVLLAPVGYVDATSSWRFSSRWQRMHTASAGLYIEFFIAAIAAWVWALTGSGFANFMAFNVIILASISSLLFNANPLMKFDGYYIFSDLIRIPNLYGLGQAFCRSLGRRLFLGLKSIPMDRSNRDKLLIGGYGIASLVWRVLVISTLLIVATSLFRGAGIIIALTAVIALFAIPGFRFIKFLLQGDDYVRPSKLHFVFSMLGTGLIVWSLFSWVSWSPTLKAPAVAEYPDIASVRADSSGFILDVNVEDQQKVKRGDILVQLVNADISARIADLELELEQLELRRQSFIFDGETAQAQVISQQMEALQEKLLDATRTAEELTIRAPSNGSLIANNIANWPGRFVQKGQEIAQIAPVADTELKLLIRQQDASTFRRQLGQSVNVYIGGHGIQKYIGVMDSMEPRASRSVRYPTMSVLGGGSLPVIRNTQPGTNESYRLLQPRFEATVKQLNHPGIFAGERGTVLVVGDAEPVARLWIATVRHWARALLDRTPAADA